MYKIIIVFVTLAALLCGCSMQPANDPTVVQTEDAAENDSLESTTEYLIQLIKSMNDEYSIDVSVNTDDAPTIHVSMTAFPTGFSFCDILYNTMTACGSVADEFDYPIGTVIVHVGYEDSFIDWETKDLNEGVLFDSTELPERMTLDDVFETYSYTPIA